MDIHLVTACCGVVAVDYATCQISALGLSATIATAEAPLKKFKWERLPLKNLSSVNCLAV